MCPQEPGAHAQSSDLIDFGEALVRVRRAQGQSQSELAGKLQVAASTVSRLERGRLPPPPDLAMRLTEVLTLDPSAAKWLQELAAHARLMHAARAEMANWEGAQRLIAWLGAQRSLITQGKEDAPTQDRK